MAGASDRNFSSHGSGPSGADQGAFMSILVGILQPSFAVEVGTFTGYSALCLARGLGEGGELLCCDISEEWTAIATRYWERAGLADRIELQIGPAADTRKRPRYALTGTFYDMPRGTTNFYLLTFQLVDIASGELIWEKPYEVKL